MRELRVPRFLFTIFIPGQCSARGWREEYIVCTEVQGAEDLEGHFAVESEPLETNGRYLVPVLVQGVKLGGLRELYSTRMHAGDMTVTGSRARQRANVATRNECEATIYASEGTHVRGGGHGCDARGRGTMGRWWELGMKERSKR